MTPVPWSDKRVRLAATMRQLAAVNEAEKPGQATLTGALSRNKFA